MTTFYYGLWLDMPHSDHEEIVELSGRCRFNYSAGLHRHMWFTRVYAEPGGNRTWYCYHITIKGRCGTNTFIGTGWSLREAYQNALRSKRACQRHAGEMVHKAKLMGSMWQKLTGDVNDTENVLNQMSRDWRWDWQRRNWYLKPSTEPVPF